MATKFVYRCQQTHFSILFKTWRRKEEFSSFRLKSSPTTISTSSWSAMASWVSHSDYHNGWWMDFFPCSSRRVLWVGWTLRWNGWLSQEGKARDWWRFSASGSLQVWHDKQTQKIPQQIRADLDILQREFPSLKTSEFHCVTISFSI